MSARRRIDVHQHIVPPAYFTGQLDAYAALDAAGHAGIDHANAAALFPNP